MPHLTTRLRRTFAVVLVLAAASVALVAPAAAQDADATASEQTFGGTIVDPDGEPVVGAVITVATDDGTEIEAVETAEDGSWSVSVPEPGDYAVSIDPDSLPEGVSLQNPDRSTLTPSIRAGQSRTINFATGERVLSDTSRVDRLSNLAAEGVKFGLMIALAALGLSVIFGVTGLVNFAHGELLAFGGIMAFWLERGLGPLPGMPLIVAAVIAMALAGLLGVGLEAGIFGPVRRRQSGAIAAMVISIGLAFVMRYLYLIFFGSRPDFYLDFRIQSQFRIGPVAIPPKSWAIIIIAGAVLLAVGWALKNTRIGTATRAVSVNKDLAESSGIDVQRVILTTWLIGGALAGLSGVMFGMAESVRWNSGEDLLLLIFAAVVLGGLGTAYGAMLGGLVVGIVTQMSTYWFASDLKLMFALMVLVVILLLRPQGILGVRERFG
ncbi:MAG: branched-chain amino acid ABC transporter permease [Acidimicrobiales bacterium]